MKSCIKQTLFALLFSISHFISSQSYGQTLDTVLAFNEGERLEYYASYNWGPIWITAGDVSFEIKSKNKNEFLFYSEGRSRTKYDWIYKIRDYYTSTASKNNLSPSYFYRNTNEGDNWVRNKYFFYHKKQIIKSELISNKKPFKRDSIQRLKKGTLDVLTAVYYARSIEFKNKKIGTKIPFRLIIDNKIHDLFVKYRGIENIKTRSGKVFRCYKFTALLVKGTIFKGGEDLDVWISCDRNRIPIQVSAKIIVGSVKAQIKNISNLKYPIESEVKPKK
ncbi:MAG: DUF3108 domain-containing protein [Bacteroidales bacterium]